MYKIVEKIYENPLATPEDIEGFRLEGEAATSFPLGRLRLENKLPLDLEQEANYVFWCDKTFSDNIEISWDFYPMREPGLCIFFFAAMGMNGEDLFDPSLNKRTGPYGHYHSGDINALHISYFRRRYAVERKFQLCNLRKSKGGHVVAQGADPIPSVVYAESPYRIKVVKYGPRVQFHINDFLILDWTDDCESFGPALEGGKIGFRQMSPMMGEYANLEVNRIEWE